MGAHQGRRDRLYETKRRSRLFFAALPRRFDIGHQGNAAKRAARCTERDRSIGCYLWTRRYIRTSHVLFVQWDSWIVDPSMWRPQFLDCDYIGAPWWYRDGLNVGNSGFSIRSKALIDFLAAHWPSFRSARLKITFYAGTIGRGSPNSRGLMRRWPTNFLLSARASAPAPARSVFHGMFNWPYVLTNAQIEARVSPCYRLRPGIAALPRNAGPAVGAARR